MEPAEFAERLSELTGPDIAALAAALRHELDSADGELSWWRATITIGANLKRHHRSREAGLAAHRASVAVLAAAARTDTSVSKDDITVVARAASEVARVLVAEHDHDVPAATIAVLLAPWRPLVSAAA
ncbi:MAG: hypothetical protein QOD92_3363 [Acidimicrobiaceae bacterium]